MWTRLAPSCSTYPWSQSLTDPRDKACHAQTATAIGSPRRCCFHSCLILGCIRAALWESAALMLTELVWDGWCRLKSVAVEKQGHQGHLTRLTWHIEDLPVDHIVGGRWCGWHWACNTSAHTTFPSDQNRAGPDFQGAVEYQRYSDVVLATLADVTGCWLPPSSGSQVVSEKGRGLATQHYSRGTSEGSSKTKGYLDTVSTVSYRMAKMRDKHGIN